MLRWVPWLALMCAACPHNAKHDTPVDVKPADHDPDGPHKDAVAAQVKPFIDSEIVRGVVVGLYDAGRLEIYGFGRGPGGERPDGHTLFELGAVTSVYTSLLFADSIQRREVALTTPVAELLPPGVTMPVFEKQAITLGHLAVHSSGLPPLPPTIAMHPEKADRFGGYTEDVLYRDLQHTDLKFAPGAHLVESPYGLGLLGLALGRKIGGGYAKALASRVLEPLKTTETFLAVPPSAAPHLAHGSNDDLADASAWTWEVLAGAGGLVSSAHDLLQLVDAELDGAAGGKLPLRAAMRLTQEPQLEIKGANLGIGWQLDQVGRYWRAGTTGGFHTWVGFDPKTKRGVVIMCSTSVSIVDRLADTMYKVLDNAPPEPAKFPSVEELVPLAGNYAIGDTKVKILVEGKRLYITGEGVKQRLVPVSDHEFWIEELQGIAVFERDKDKVVRVVFAVQNQQITAARED